MGRLIGGRSMERCWGERNILEQGKKPRTDTRSWTRKLAKRVCTRPHREMDYVPSILHWSNTTERATLRVDAFAAQVDGRHGTGKGYTCIHGRHDTHESAMIR